jgi:hypothetical protein
MIEVILQTESGGVISEYADETNVMQGVFHRAAIDPGSYLFDIDWYGETIFNRGQAPKVLKEWLAIEKFFSTKEERALFVYVRNCLERMPEEPHWYLRLIGD